MCLSLKVLFYSELSEFLEGVYFCSNSVAVIFVLILLYKSLSLFPFLEHSLLSSLSLKDFLYLSHAQFSSVAQSCLTLCKPMNCSTPGLPVHHHLSEFTQTHVHWVGDAIQPSHPRSSPSPPALNPSQHQSLFQWVKSLHEVSKVLELRFSIIPSEAIPGLISFRMDW